MNELFFILPYLILPLLFSPVVLVALAASGVDGPRRAGLAAAAICRAFLMIAFVGLLAFTVASVVDETAKLVTDDSSVSQDEPAIDEYGDEYESFEDDYAPVEESFDWSGFVPLGLATLATGAGWLFARSRERRLAAGFNSNMSAAADGTILMAGLLAMVASLAIAASIVPKAIAPETFGGEDRTEALLALGLALLLSAVFSLVTVWHASIWKAGNKVAATQVSDETPIPPPDVPPTDVPSPS